MRFNTNNPIGTDGSRDPRDLYDNAGVADLLLNGPLGEYLSRLGVPLKSWRGIMQQVTDYLAAQGYEADSLAYAVGVRIERQTQLVERSGELYKARLLSDLPLVLSGDWTADAPKLQSIGDAALRSSLAAAGSQVQISGHPASEYQRLLESLPVDPDGRVRNSRGFVAGDGTLPIPMDRDGFVVSRTVTVTDRHGFKDNTVIGPGVSDYGGYGAMDVTIRLEGPNAFDHAASYQSRINYAGSGSLAHLWGYLATPTHSGSGTIAERIEIDLHDVNKSGGGAITDNIGIALRDQGSGLNNVGMNIAQTTGRAIHAGGGAPSYHAGPLAIGVSADFNGVYLSIKGAVSGPVCFANAVIDSVQFGAIGDAPVQIVTNGAVRLSLGGSADAYAIYPGTDGGQDLGRVDRRFNNVRALTGTIQTSDSRLKTEVRAFSGEELAAFIDLSKEIGAYKFLAAVREKGDVAREHIGMTVQRAIEIMEGHGLDPYGYGFICYDRWDEQKEVVVSVKTGTHFKMTTIQKEDSSEFTFKEVIAGGIEEPGRLAPGEFWEETGEREMVAQAYRAGGDIYSFRMDGLMAAIAAGLEARLTALEEKA